MKKVIIFIGIILCVALGLNAYNFVSNPYEYNSIITNPAALSYYDNFSITLQKNWQKKAGFSKSSEFYFNLGSIGYYLSSKSSNTHILSSSAKIATNLYLGDSYLWSGKEIKNGKYNISMLYRPLNLISIGLKANDIIDKHNHSADLGLSLRPIYLNGKFYNRFDLDIASRYNEGKFLKPAIGIKTEFIDGLVLKGDYNLEDKTTSIGFSFNFGGMESGTKINTYKKEVSGSSYITFSKKVKRNIVYVLKSLKPAYYDFKLRRKLVDVQPEGIRLGFMNIKMNKYITHKKIKQILDDLSKDKTIKGIVIQNPKTHFGITDIEELKPAFDKFKKSGKKIVFYFDGISASDYLFAATFGDKIYLNPQGEVTLPHLGVKSPYFKELLNKLGIKVQNFRSHKFKTAGNMFSENKMTDAEKETYKTLLSDISKTLNNLILQNRGSKLKKPIKEIINQKPFYNAEEAYQLGLIDGVIYQSELKGNLDSKDKKSAIVKNYQKIQNSDWSSKSKSKVAIIYAVGNIHTGKNRYGKSIGSQTLSEAIRKARKDKSIKGIIIRVNSGGGSALASDIIAHEVELARKENKKPVVISMGRVAASGGYYISALADKIIAHPTTITGSIGVIGMIPDLSVMYKKIGVNWSELKIDKYAGFPPTERPMTQEEKKIIKDSIHKYYWDFVGVVSKGRGKSKEEINKIAQGRVWSGYSALRNGLIDKFGGLETAKEEIKKLAHIKNDIELVEFKGKTEKSNPFGFGSNVIFSFMPNDLKNSISLLNNFKTYKKEHALYLTPVTVTIEK